MAAEGTRILDSQGATQAGLADALSAWSEQPSLAAALADPGSAYLVLDDAASRILHASDGARALAHAIAGGNGVLRSGPLPGQIRGVSLGAAPQLVRMRLDPRRIAPPTLCLLARGDVDGERALLLIAAGPLPALRGPTVKPGRTAEMPSTGEAPQRPSVGDRFVWRSDAASVVSEISGTAGPALAPALAGRSWIAAAEEGLLLEAGAFLPALAGNRTFRGVNVVLRLPEAAMRLSIELAAAPVGRSAEGFSGYGGYGVIRSIEAIEPAAVSPKQAVADADPSSAEAYRAGESGAASTQASGLDRPVSLPDADLAVWPPALVSTDRPDPSKHDDTLGASAAPATTAATEPTGSSPHGLSAVSSAVTRDHPDTSVGGLDDPAAPDEDAEAALSITEHAAFREIARALGARYAGDDEAAPGAADLHHAESGAVMPFPNARPPDALSPAALTASGGAAEAFLEGLPAAILIICDDRVLAANARLLELTGYADVPALEAAGTGRLFRGASPDRHQAVPGSTAANLPVLIETAGGASRPVAVERGRTVWAGTTADCLILHPVPDVDPAGERLAAELAQRFRDDHAADAEATLDALDEGIVTLDPAARIVAMNRAATTLLACDPREVVGVHFAGLFDAGDADAIRHCLDHRAATVASAGGRRLGLRIVGHAATQVVVLREPAPPAAEREDRAAFLGHLDQALRTPVAELVEVADTMLREPYGAMDARDRERLREIQTSGEHALGLVTDLFELATIEAGGLTLCVRPLPLNELVSGCVATLQAQAAQGRIVMRTSYAPDLAMLEADEPSLRQAALNVIANAIKFTGAGGQVIVSTMPSERGGVALKVRDTGPGMSSEEIDEVFKPLGSNRTGGPARASGTRGLPLTRALVEANRGRLRISSRKEEGTLVEILLPARQAGGD